MPRSSRARLRLAHDVQTLQQGGDRLGLDGRGLLETKPGHRFEEFRRKAEVGEKAGGHQ